MKKEEKIYIAGHTGMVGSAIWRNLEGRGYQNLIGRTMDELDLISQHEVAGFFEAEKPEYVILAAAKVGGIHANNTLRAQFIYENLMIQNNVIHQSYLHRVKKLLFLGSSCIFPKNCPQPMDESYLLTGELEPTNEPYAIAKIAGIKTCESYYRQYGCDFISVMPTNLYGPNDNYNLANSHVLPALIRKFHLGKCLERSNWDAIIHDLNHRPIDGIDGSADRTAILNLLAHYGISTGELTLWGSGQVFREFMHVDDMAAACIHVLQTTGMSDLCKPPLYNNCFVNVGTGEELTVEQLAVMVRDIVGFSGNIKWDATKPDGIKRKLLNSSRLYGTGFKPAISLYQGISQVYARYKE